MNERVVNAACEVRHDHSETKRTTKALCMNEWTSCKCCLWSTTWL